MRKLLFIVMAGVYAGSLCPMAPQSKFTEPIAQFGDQVRIVADRATYLPDDIQAALGQMQDILAKMEKDKAGGAAGSALKELKTFRYTLPAWVQGAGELKSPAEYRGGKDPFREFNALIKAIQKSLAEELTGTKETLTETRIQLADMQTDLANALDQVRRQSLDIVNLKKTVEQGGMASADLEMKLSNAEETIKATEQRAKTLRADLLNAMAGQATAQRKCTEATQQAACSAEEHRKAAAEVERLKAMLLEVEAAADAQREEMADFKKRVEILAQAEQGKFEEAYTALDKKYTKALDDLQEIKTESTQKAKAAEKTIYELKTKLDQAIKKANVASKKGRGKTQEAEKQKQEAKAESAKLKAQIIELEEQIDRFRDRVALLQIQAAATKKAEADKEKLQAEIDRLKGELETRRVEITEFTAMLGSEDAEHQAALKTLTEKFDFQQRTLEKTQEEVDRALADRKAAMAKCAEEQACRIDEQKLYEETLAAKENIIKTQLLAMNSLQAELEKLGREKPGLWQKAYAKVKAMITKKKS